MRFIFRALLIIGAVVVLCLPGAVAQMGSNWSSVNGLALIDDTKAVAPVTPRYTIQSAGPQTILLDTDTGRSWLLTRAPKSSGCALQWVEIPKVPAVYEDQDRMSPQDEPSPPEGDFDPFGPQ
jgi:hypothetical protein